MTRLVKITGTTLADVLNGSGLADKIKGRKGNDVVDGGAGDDRLKGEDGNDLISGGQGNDRIDGGKGVDTAVYQGLYAQYVLAFAKSGEGTVQDTVANRDGTDTLKKVELVLFEDALYDVVSDTVFVLDPNDAPALANAIGDRSFAEDEPVSFSIPANAFVDPDGDALGYTAVLDGGAPLPAWLVFDGSTRSFSGAPPLDFSGSLDIRVTASDGSASAFDVFRLTIDPVNDAPTVTVSPITRSIFETAPIQTITAALLLAQSGAADVDGDTLTIVDPQLFGPDGAAVDVNNPPPGVSVVFAPDGSFESLAFDPADFAFLPASTEVQLRLEFDISDGLGGSVHDSLIVTVLGVNSPAVIGQPNAINVIEDVGVVGGNLLAIGTIPIGDVDAGQAAFTGSVFSFPGNLGALSIAANGAYTYSVSNSAVQFLGVGGPRLESFIVQAIDGTTRTVQFRIHGSNDPVVLEPFNATHQIVEEIGTPSPGPGFDLANNIAFSDVDAADDHTVTSVFVPGSDPQIGSFSATLLSDTTNGTGGLAHWEYHVDAAAIEFLGANEHRLEMYRINIGDGHAGAANPTLFFDLVGTNDAPVIQGAPTIVRSLQAPVAPGPLLLSDSFGFSDVDVSDNHTVDAFFNVGLSGSPTQFGQLFATFVSGTTNGVGGFVEWDYIVDASLVNTLPLGIVRTDAFDVRVDDGNGGIAQQQVIVSIAGGNNPPSALADTAFTAEGVLTLIDVLANDSDPEGQTLSLAGVSQLSGDPPTPTTSTLFGSTVSVLGNDVLYDPTTSPIISTLLPGQPFFDNFAYTVTDGFGGFSIAQVNVQIMGV